MKARAISVILASVTITILCFGQSSSSKEAQGGLDDGAAGIATRRFVPRIIGRTNRYIVSGRIASLRGQRLEIESARGSRLDFELAEHTSLLASTELVSIATLDDLMLQPSDLRPGLWVEVVAERQANRSVACIVTVLDRSKK